MKWILFLMFAGQGHEPLVEFQNASECVNIRNQLQAASDKVNGLNAFLETGIMTKYICEPVPNRYEGANCKSTRCR